MGNSLLAVEGVHDAAFFGLLLARRGFQKVANVADVPAVWERLIPRNFPVNDRLDHVVHYPDMFVHPGKVDTSVAIVVGRGQSAIADELKNAIGILPLEELDKIGVCVDADMDATHAFSEIVKIFNEINVWGVEQGVLQTFLDVPTQPNSFSAGIVRLGGLVLPDNTSSGALETLLLGLANEKFSDLSERSFVFIDQVDQAHLPSDGLLKKFRKGGNRHKTHAAIISNFLRPGSNLAVAIEQCGWLPENEHPLLAGVKVFVDEFTA